MGIAVGIGAVIGFLGSKSSGSPGPAGEAIDLSMLNYAGEELQSRTTANSYCVHSPGKYSIPLVYGCAIKNGGTNALSYTTKSGTYTGTFYNHKADTISSPYIEQHSGCSAQTAGLLWQTHLNMISDVNLEDAHGDTCRSISFTVNSIPATNGLAVLYIKDMNDEIIWSWTLWLVSDTLSTIRIYSTYEMMSLPFGAMWNAARTKYVLPYYQFGRKDALVPAESYDSSVPMSVYDIDGDELDWGSAQVSGGREIGTLGTFGTQEYRTVADGIKNPGLFLLALNTSGINRWFPGNGINYWNYNNTSSKSADQLNAVKTVYDPLPAGFMVPSYWFCSGITTTTNTATSVSKFRKIGSWDSGWYFKNSDSDNVGTFWPALGIADCATGNILNIGRAGYFKVFTTDGQYNEWGPPCWLSDAIYLNDGSSPAYGMPVWGTVEQT